MTTAARIVLCGVLAACAHAAPSPEAVHGYADVNGLHMYYEIHGHGRPILLLHGGIGGISYWSKILPALAQNHRVIAPEQMGHGRTADVPSREFSYAQMANDTAALLAHLGVERVDVVGMSDGGIVGYLLAIDRPGLVRKLVTSGANVDGEGLPPPKTGEVKPEQIPKMFRDDYEKLSPDGPGHFNAFINRVASMWRRYPYVERSRLAAIRCPTLIIMGDHDFPGGGGLHIAQAIPGAQLMIVPGTGHGTFTHRPELMKLAVLEFLDAEPSSTATH